MEVTMKKENFYLDILNNLNTDLKYVIDNQYKYNPAIYNAMLAGIIIRLSTLVDQFMIDFHSPLFTPVVEYIYSARQELVHYSDFTNLNDLTAVACDISSLIDQTYENEKQYFEEIINRKYNVEHNVVVAGNKNITYDRANKAYIFSSDNATIWVSEDRITRIKDSNSNRGVLYIISCDKNMNCFYKENGEIIYEELIAPEELKRFFKSNFKVVNVDYKEYMTVIEELLNKFYKKGNYGTIYVCPKNKPNQRKKIGKVLNAYFNRGIIYKDLLSNIDYSSIKVPSDSFFNYKQIRSTATHDL